MPNDFTHYLDKMVVTKEKIPADKRGHYVPAGSLLYVYKVYGQHMDLAWPEGGRAATQVHYSKLKTGPEVPA